MLGHRRSRRDVLGRGEARHGAGAGPRGCFPRTRRSLPDDRFARLSPRAKSNLHLPDDIFNGDGSLLMIKLPLASI